jgi:hypothetical protein
MVLFGTVISQLQLLVLLLNANKIETEEMLGNFGLVFLLGFIAFFPNNNSNIQKWLAVLVNTD